MKNLSLNELGQIERISNLLLNKPKQIAKTRHIKSNKNTSKEELLIALLKSNQSHTELCRSEVNNTKIVETKKLFNELRKHYTKKLQKYEKIFKELKENLSRLERNQYNDNKDLDYEGIRQ